jgi:dolichol-phosphate mannosyltransferase
LTSSFGVHYLVSNLITLGGLFLSRLLISDHFIWKTDQATAAAAITRARPTGSIGPPPLYLYDVGGLVCIASEIVLHELQYFRVPSLGSSPDLRIRVGTVGSPGLRPRPVVTYGPSFVAYDEHLGRRAANFRLDFQRDGIEVAVAPLLGRSPHVVYTNVVEALLRFVLVSRGRVLLHSATVELGGRGVMVTGRTDTGKTSTILRLLRDCEGRFLSDDMTIVEPHGVARCFPKPLTISAHTMRAVNRHALATNERLRLAVRSRVHSRSGRRLGSRLAALDLPIMALNAVTQELIPPPKYMIDELLPCGYREATEVRDLFVIERGPFGLEEIDHRRALDVLIENTDDAYSFPPFRYFAPAISIDGESYSNLRQRERALLSTFLTDVRVRRLVRDDFSWADAIPLLVNGQRAG